MLPGLVRHLPTMLKTDRAIAGIDFRLHSGSYCNKITHGLAKRCAGSLRELQLDAQVMEHAAYAVIGQCTQLRKLNLCKANSEFTGDRLKEILLNNPHLENLKLSDCESPLDEGLAQMFHLTNLRRLCLSGCEKITNKLLCDLGKITTLRSLNLKYLNVDSRVLRSLASLKDLEAFFISSNYMDSECLAILCDNFKKLKKLDLGRVQKLTDPDAMKLCYLRELRSLEFDNAVGFTDRAFWRGLGPFFIETLTIDGCRITDDGLEGIAVHNGCLKKLTIANCAYITDAGLTKLLEREPLLEDLWLERCASLSSDWLLALQNICPRLRRLGVRGFQITVSAAVRFGRTRPHVRVH